MFVVLLAVCRWLKPVPLRPWGQIGPEVKLFRLGLEHLASVLLTWPRKCAIQCKIISVVSISWLYHCNIHYRDAVKHTDVGQKFSYELLALSPLCSCSEISTCGRPIYSYMTSDISISLDLGVTSSFNITDYYESTATDSRTAVES